MWDTVWQCCRAVNCQNSPKDAKMTTFTMCLMKVV